MEMIVGFLALLVVVGTLFVVLQILGGAVEWLISRFR